MSDPPSDRSSTDGSAVAASAGSDARGTHRTIAAGTDGTDVAAFELIDWDDVERSSFRRSPERIALAVGLVALVATYLYHRSTGETYLVLRWNVGPADWLLLLSIVVITAYGVVPAARNRRTVRRAAARLGTRRPTLLSLAFLAVILLTGVYTLLSGLQPRLTLETGTYGLDRFQPPVGFSGPYMLTQFDCVGEVTGTRATGRTCHGTWTYALGTDGWGYKMSDILVVGMQPVVYATAVTMGVIVPIATTVGLVAGYYGGLVDDLLMAYVDVQLSVPAILLYLVAWLFLGNSLWLLLVAFGLLSWGGIARIVRSETLQRREEGYVLAARAVGARDGYVLRRHLFPNVSNTVVPATFHLIAVLVLTEAALSSLGFHVSFQSWGMTIAEGVFRASPTATWWNAALPAVALALTVASLKVAGDGLRAVLDPRGES